MGNYVVLDYRRGRIWVGVLSGVDTAGERHISVIFGFREMGMRKLGFYVV